MSSVASRMLAPHPGTAPGTDFRIEAEVARDAGGVLRFRFLVEGDVARLEIPPRVEAPRQKHLLWQHTCFEAFVAAQPGGAYHELNFSPSGEWAHYAFRAYREGGWVPGEAVAPGIAVEAGKERLVLTARIPIAGLDRELTGVPLQLALSAVLEERSGRLSHWALHHPGEKADFHAASAFEVRLDPPNREGRIAP